MSQTPFHLTGRDIWVIGGAGYLGQAVVNQLTQLGASVLCVDLPGRASASPGVTPAGLDAADGHVALRAERDKGVARK